MPVCTEESVRILWAKTASGGSSPPSPSTPLSCSPPPPRFLTRSSSSTFTLLDRRFLTPSPPPPPPDPIFGLLARLIGWYPTFLLKFARNLLAAAVYLIWSQFFLMGPTIWLSATLWLTRKFVQLPLVLFKTILGVVVEPPSEYGRRKRTVVISGGGSVQTVHLARNFYSAGARVVVVELDGLFGLARWSTAVDKFYSIPPPRGDRSDSYFAAIEKIILVEKASYYIPVCSSSTAYYDALFKPHLESLGVVVFCPNLKEVCFLDDVAQLLTKCDSVGLSTPEYYTVESKGELDRLYDVGTLTTGRHMMFSSGQLGCRDRLKFLLPHDKTNLTTLNVSRQRPWVVVRDYPGSHYVTCTTVKDGKIVANVICRVEGSASEFVPCDNKEIDVWLSNLFTRVKRLANVSGHMSFRFVESTNSGSVVPLGCRVGVSPHYICHTSAHPRLVWRPCRHVVSSSPSSGLISTSLPLVLPGGRYWIHAACVELLQDPKSSAFGRFVTRLLCRNEALFALWDPLPYCVFYHVHLPLSTILRLLRGTETPSHHPRII